MFGMNRQAVYFVLLHLVTGEATLQREHPFVGLRFAPEFDAFRGSFAFE